MKATLRRLLPVVPVAVAAALCLHRLGRWPQWVDEAFTWMVIRRNFDGIVLGAAKDRHPPLYYLLASPFTELGDTDFVLRLPSAIAAIGAVAVLVWAAFRHLEEEEAWVAATVAALSPFVVLFAHTARMYALLALFGAVMTMAALQIARGRGVGLAAVALAIGAAGAIWTHYAALAGIGGAAMGAVIGALLDRDAPMRARLTRAAVASVAVGVALASFLPWAQGPLQEQLATKDAPAARTLSVLKYLFWNFDGRVPTLSWVVLALQALGVGVAAWRRGPVGGVLLGFAISGVLAPWYASRSEPAQNPRNYITLLPASAMLAALGAAGVWHLLRRAIPRLPGSAAVLAPVLALLAVDPLKDLLTRPVSPQEPGTWFHYKREALELDYAIPRDTAVQVKPAYMLRQLARYAPGLDARAQRMVLPRRAWLGYGRTETPDAALVGGYSARCTFKNAFRLVWYAPDGPGCETLLGRMALVGETDGYPPFLLELALREAEAKDFPRAVAHARQAAEVVRGHPSPWAIVADISIKARDFDTAADAAHRALDIARRWRFPGGAIAAQAELEAQALAALGRAEEADAALAVSRCARAHPWPYLCGTWLEFVRRPDVSGAASVKTSTGAIALPAPVPTGLPAPTEPQDEAPPADPPADMERAELWTMDGPDLPEGWATFNGAKTPAAARVADGAMTVGSTEAPQIALACSAALPAAGKVAVRMRWKADVVSGSTWAVLEVRPTDADGNVLQSGGPIIARLLASPGSTDWRVDRVDYAMPEGAVGAKVCLKADGSAATAMTVDWLEVARGGAP